MKGLPIKIIDKIPANAKGLITTSTYNGFATLVKILLGLISNKINSIYLGPIGYALLGQYTNYAAIASTFATGGIHTGLIKYVSEYYNEQDKREKVINTSVVIMLVCSAVIGIISIALCRFFSVSLLKSPQYWSIFVIAGLMITLNSMGLFISSLLNALKHFTKLITTQIIMNFVSLGVTIPLVIFLNVYGSLLAIFIVAPITTYINFRFLLKTGFDFKNIKLNIDRESLIKLSNYSVMAITTALTVPVAQLIIRNFIIAHVSTESAGHWQGIIKLSDMYMAVILSSISLYYLPRLSEIKNKVELKKEIFLGYSILLPLFTVVGLVIFFLRDFIIQTLYTQSFIPMRELFPFQLLGDFFKIAGWLLSFLMLAKAKVKMYIITEISFSVLYLIFSIIFINNYGIVGITYAYFLKYFLYFGLFVFLFRGLIFYTEGIPEK